MTTPNSSSSQTKPQQQQQQRRQKFVLFRFVNFFFSKNNLVLGILSVFLGLLFIFYGLLKVSTVISSEMHRELGRSFVKFSKVLPWTRLFGLKVPSRYFRLSVGYSEIIGGLVLVVAPWERVKLAANLLLLAVSLNATICNCLVDEAFDRQTPAIVFTMMLTCRLVVHYQVLRRKAKKESKQKRIEADVHKISSLAKEKAIFEVLKRNGICPEEFMKRIAKLGFTDSFIDSLAPQHLMAEQKEEGEKKKEVAETYELKEE